MAISKVILNGTTLIDVTKNTITPDTLLTGLKATDASGTSITGTVPDGDNSSFGIAASTASTSSKVSIGTVGSMII